MPASTRRISLDVTTLTIGGTALIGTLLDADLTITSDTIDVTAMADAWRVLRLGPSAYTITGTKLIDTNPVMAGMHIARAQVTWTTNLDGATRYGSGYLSNSSARASQGAREEETWTLEGDGTIG